MKNYPFFKIGLGKDSHRIKVNPSTKLRVDGERPSTSLGTSRTVKTQKPLILGGVLINKTIEVEADSDGDVIFHALCNALSSAIGGPSLGVYTKPMCLKGITDSREYMKFFHKMIERKNHQVNNVTISVETKIPQLEPYSAKIKEEIACLLKIKPEDVGVTFTSGEDLTSFGKGQGIEALAIVSLLKL